MPTQKITPAPLTRSLGAIAEEIAQDWPKVTETGTPSAFGNVGQNPANPYWDAMRGMRNLDSRIGSDSAVYVVTYFLENTQGWRGETAKRIKAELRAALADHRAKGGR